MNNKRTHLIANSIITLFIILIVLTFASVTLFGLIGVFKIGSFMNLISIDLYPNTFSNFLYFGALLISSYTIALFIEILTRLLLRLLNRTTSLSTNILSYAIQITLAFLAITVLLETIFTRIEAMNLSVFIFTLVLYVIIFFSSDAHKEIDDLELED